MRRTFLTLLATISPMAVGAQRVLSDRQQLPTDVRREVADKWNRPNALRSSDRLEIEAGREVSGDVAVQRGPLIIAGHVIGSVVAVNSDVILQPTARIDGNLLVVGGDVDGRNSAFIGGSTRIYRQSLSYRMDGDQLIPADSGSSEGATWWQRLERSADPGRQRFRRGQLVAATRARPTGQRVRSAESRPSRAVQSRGRASNRARTGDLPHHRLGKPSLRSVRRRSNGKQLQLGER